MAQRSKLLNKSKPWKAWIVGLTERFPVTFNTPPDKQLLRSTFLTGLRSGFGYSNDKDAEKAAQQMGIKFAVSAPSGVSVSYFRIEDLPAKPQERRAPTGC